MMKTSKRWMVLATLIGLFVPAAGAAPAPRLNILHIHADDHRPDGLRALGNPVLQTPNLDTLVERGMTFTRAYTMGSMVGAVCLPSRTMMLTGKSWLRIPGAREGDPERTLPRLLAAAGYETFHVGKGGNEYTVGIEAFEHNIVMDDRGRERRAGSSRRHADAVLKFLGERDRDRPFYIYMAPPVPHDPRSAEPQFHALYDPKEIPLSPAFMPLHPFDNGEMTVRDEKLAPWPRTPEDTRRQLADYYACITGLDYHAGRIFEALRKSGEWENTLVIFTGDNGLSLGEHGLFGKQNLYEFGGMHVPCVIAGPGVVHGRSEAFVYLMDLYPTLCEAAGAPVPDGCEGRSLWPILRGGDITIRETIYTAYKDCQRAVRDDRWKLIVYPKINYTQLFDLFEDPHELNNLAEDPAFAGHVEVMKHKLIEAQRLYGDDCPLSSANPAPMAWTPPAGQ